MQYSQFIMTSQFYLTYTFLWRYKYPMINLNVEELRAEMILAKPVYNHQDLLLLEAGAKITEKNIRMFKSWGVTAVWIKGDSSDDNSKGMRSDAESREVFEIELRERFADVLDNPVMLEIMRAARNVLSKHINEKDEEK